MRVIPSFLLEQDAGTKPVANSGHPDGAAGRVVIMIVCGLGPCWRPGTMIPRRCSVARARAFSGHAAARGLGIAQMAPLRARHIGSESLDASCGAPDDDGPDLRESILATSKRANASVVRISVCTSTTPSGRHCRCLASSRRRGPAPRQSRPGWQSFRIEPVMPPTRDVVMTSRPLRRRRSRTSSSHRSPAECSAAAIRRVVPGRRRE
jgi:hypothetical protein